jgi:hypothetical protein
MFEILIYCLQIHLRLLSHFSRLIHKNHLLLYNFAIYSQIF